MQQLGGKRPDGKPRWTTLELPYSVLPPAPKQYGQGPPVLIIVRGVDPQPLHLPREAEEPLHEYIRLGGTTGVTQPTLMGSAAAAENFWADWKEILSQNLPPGTPIRSLSDIDTTYVRAWLKERPRSRSSAPDRFAIVDGKVQRLVPQSVDRPGIFSGRNIRDPNRGRIRRMLMAADLTFNIGRGAAVPNPGAAVQHDNTVDWVVRWLDPITHKKRYLRLAPSSPSEQGGFLAKFNLAQRVLHAMPRYARRYDQLLASRHLAAQQLGVCLWMIGNLGVRVGGVAATGSSNAVTHGATTLQVRHISIGRAGSAARIDFPGKDGIRYVRSINVPPSVAKAVRASQSGKGLTDALFDRVSADKVNRQIFRLVPGASAKVIRTAQTCALFEHHLLAAEASIGHPHGAPLPRAAARSALLIALARAAMFCNHRKTCTERSVMDLSLLETELDRIEREYRNRPTDISRAVRLVVNRGCVSMYTIRTSYIDPRIIFAFCARNNFPVNSPLCFGAGGIASRNWAKNTQGDFRFFYK